MKRLKYFLLRWKFIILNYKNYPKELNRRAGVEQKLWDCYHGKSPLPDREQCKEWAKTLGIPEQERFK